MNLAKLPTFKQAGIVRCVVESPQGAAAKYKYDPEVKAFELSRCMPKGLTYPFDWGFIPSTLAADDDPLDAMVIHDAATFPGLVIACQIIGVLEVMQKDAQQKPQRNDRIFLVPVNAHREDKINDVADLPKRLRKELETFFLAAAQLQDKKIELLGWKGPKAAERIIHEGQSAFDKQSK